MPDHNDAEALVALLNEVHGKHRSDDLAAGRIGCRTCAVALQIERSEDGRPLFNPFIRHIHEQQAIEIAAYVARQVEEHDASKFQVFKDLVLSSPEALAAYEASFQGFAGAEDRAERWERIARACRRMLWREREELHDTLSDYGRLAGRTNLAERERDEALSAVSAADMDDWSRGHDAGVAEKRRAVDEALAEVERLIQDRADQLDRHAATRAATWRDVAGFVRTHREELGPVRSHRHHDSECVERTLPDGRLRGACLNDAGSEPGS
jgi:hypothetical protein